MIQGAFSPEFGQINNQNRKTEKKPSSLMINFPNPNTTMLGNYTSTCYLKILSQDCKCFFVVVDFVIILAA